MPFKIVQDDITRMKVDAIVNSANPHAIIGGGVDYAIHAASGPELIIARKNIGEISTGSAFITPAFDLKAKYVIHTVGPVWRGGTENEVSYVRECYKNSLQVALENKCDSIAFPLISAGIFGFPKAKSLQIALSVISEFLLTHEMKVVMVVFDQTFNSLSEELFSSVSNFIEDNYCEEPLEDYDKCILNEEIEIIENNNLLAPSFQNDEICTSHTINAKRSLDALMKNVDETFSQSLLRLINEKDKTEVQVYKKANVDRKLFSKIRSNKYYKPSKITAISFAIALELNLDETKDLIKRAGFAFSHCTKFDLIIEYFIESENYDVFEINEVLFSFNQSPLGV
jgi:O-acetyl-ADP-ribose deacetylase (regulator of RNase III)